MRDQGAEAALVEAGAGALDRAAAQAEGQALGAARDVSSSPACGRARAAAAEARERLQAIYAWFTEGFHTPDLRAAKTLLDDLGSASGGSGRPVDLQANVARRSEDKAPPR